LVQKAQRGNKAAFGKLYEAYFSQIYYFALRQLNSEDQAQEVAQETFLKVLLQLDNLKNPQAFQNWLYHIAHSVLQDMARRLARDKAHQCELDGATADLLADSQDQLDEEDLRLPLSEQVFDSDFGREFVRSALGKLTDIQRETVLLYYFAGLKPREIAPILDLTAAAVSKRLHDAHRALQQVANSVQQQAAVAPQSDQTDTSVSVALRRFFANDLSQTDATAAREQTAAHLAILVPMALSTGMSTGAAAAGRAGFFAAQAKGHVGLGAKLLTVAHLSATKVVGSVLILALATTAGVAAYSMRNTSHDAPAAPPVRTAAPAPSPRGATTIVTQESTPTPTTSTPTTSTPAPVPLPAPSPARPVAKTVPSPAPAPVPEPEPPALRVAFSTLTYAVGTELSASRIIQDAGVSVRTADGTPATITVMRLETVNPDAVGVSVVFVRATDAAGRVSNTKTITIAFEETGQTP